MSLELAMRAAAFAAEAHRRQRRKMGDQPYINHLLRVADETARAGLSPEAVAAALLHDTVEDTEVRREDLQRAFPERVVHLVHLLTQWWSDHAPAEVKEAEKPRYYAAILQDPEAVDIKLLDRADNLRDMVRCLPAARRWAEKYLRKTEAEIAPLYHASRNTYARRAYSRALEALREALAAGSGERDRASSAGGSRMLSAGRWPR